MLHATCYMLHDFVHDFLLAKEIIDELKKIADDQKILKVSSVNLEIGVISLAHDGISEHIEDVNVENLEFGLESIAKGTVADGAKFVVVKSKGDSWKITEIEGE